MNKEINENKIIRYNKCKGKTIISHQKICFIYSYLCYLGNNGYTSLETKIVCDVASVAVILLFFLCVFLSHDDEVYDEVIFLCNDETVVACRPFILGASLSSETDVA